MIIRLAMASPLTNFMAPSMAPNSWLSRSSALRRRLASSPLMMPLRASLSMLICLPGSASSAKRAATSATRSAPLVITTNCTTEMIRNTTSPTTTLPEITNSPNVRMISPASACVSTSLLVVMEMDSRNTVVSRITVGRVENSDGLGRYTATISSSMEMPILTAISTSAAMVGIGSTIMASVHMMRTTRAMSGRMGSRRRSPPMAAGAAVPAVVALMSAASSRCPQGL